MCCHRKCWCSEMRIYNLVLRETALVDADGLGQSSWGEAFSSDAFTTMLMSSLSALPASQSGVHTHPVLSNSISSHSSSHFPTPSIPLLTATTFSRSIQPSLMICLKRGLQFLTTLPCSVSFPDMDLPCGHLLAHKMYPIHLFLDFPAFPLRLFQKYLSFETCFSCLPLQLAQTSPNFPICFSPLIFPAPASPPTSFPLLGSSSSAPTTVLLQELALLMTKPHFCSSCKVLFRKLLCVYSHFCCRWEQWLKVSAGVKTEGWCWGS